MQTINKRANPRGDDQRLRLRVGTSLLCTIVLVQALSTWLMLH